MYKRHQRKGLIMGKIAFIFPGQGAQKPFMGKDFYDKYPECRHIFDEAEKALDIDFKTLIFNEDTRLNDTKYTQPSMVLVSIMMMEALKSYGIFPDVTCGLSLGEYSALNAGGYLDFIDIMKLIKLRGDLMNSCAEKHNGAMAALIGVKDEKLQELLEDGKKHGVISVANYNCPGQVVITGEEEAIQWAVDNIRIYKGIKGVRLNVSGAFHSIFMEEASKGLFREFHNISMKDGIVPMALNFDGNISSDKEYIREALINGVKSPVYFQNCVEAMINDGVTTFIEIGPGNTLTSFVKKIDRSLKTFNIDSVEALREVVDNLNLTKEEI